MKTTNRAEKVIRLENLSERDFMVFDHLLFRDDVSTPLAVTMRPATVVCRYGQRVHYPCMEKPWIYPDLCDVIFDHRPDRVSKGHFTYGIRLLETEAKS